MIIENCNSGAMRQDNGILKHFHMQSSSDQEHYEKYASITVGSLAGLLPEQAGLWSYPYPLHSRYKDNAKEYLMSKEYQDMVKDGEMTTFIMVNGMAGSMYLSGRLEYADDFNFDLVKEGVNLYKDIRGFIKNSYPVWPLGFISINNSDAWACIGNTNDNNDKMYLSVWRLESNEEFKKIPLDRFAGKDLEIKQVYPKAKDMQVNYSFNKREGSFVVNLPKRNSARLFEIIVK